jgi:hypothetical protein
MDVRATRAFDFQKGAFSISTIKFLQYFQFLWVTFALLDPDPQLNADQDPADLKINASPDPQHY